MPLLGTAAVLILFDRAPGTIDAFYDWHDGEHMPERLGVPGFLRGRRFRADAGSPAFLILYELVDPAVLAGDEYRRRLDNPTEQSRRVGPLARNNLRASCRVAFSAGRGTGGTMLAVRFAPRDGDDPALGAALRDGLARIAQRRGIAGAHWLVADMAASTEDVVERRTRTITVPPAALLVEGNDAASVGAAFAECIGEAHLSSFCAGRSIEATTHVLERCLLPGDVTGRATP